MTQATTDSAEAGSTFVLDLGSRRRKQVKKLRKGGGSLMTKINETVDQLREDGELTAAADVVVVVVKQKSAKSFRLFG